MIKKQLSLEAAINRLIRKEILIIDHKSLITGDLLYRMVIIPETLHMGLRDWAAFDRIRRDAPCAYIFEGRGGM
jgi:hypothetical protein